MEKTHHKTVKSWEEYRTYLFKWTNELPFPIYEIKFYLDQVIHCDFVITYISTIDVTNHTACYVTCITKLNLPNITKQVLDNKVNGYIKELFKDCFDWNEITV